MSSTLNFLMRSDLSGKLPFRVLDDEFPSDVYRSVQNWVMCFLTKQGTRKADPGYGTPFLTRLESGRLLEKSDVVSAFNEANTICLGYCVDDDNLYVQNAFLTQVSVDDTDAGKYLVLYIAFAFSDGTFTRTFIEI